MPYSAAILSDQHERENVFALYRKDSTTLGFLPDGAFEQAIANGHLLVARDDSGQLAGYLLFRLAKGRAVIVHLCVASEQRGKGLARLLVDKLKCVTSHLECIILRCRKDYSANHLWPKMGFTPRGHARGRGADCAWLTIWRFDHGHDDLFSTSTSEKTKVVIDTNIFLDLSFLERPNYDSSKGLMEGWLEEIIELVVTPEIYNDINRCADPSAIARTMTKVSAYGVLRANIDEVERLTAALKKLCPDLTKSERGISDIRHIAYSIAGGAKYFVTRDKLILEKAPEILQKFDLHLLTTSDLIVRHDEIERESEYQPRRLLATKLTTSRLKPDMIGNVSEIFRNIQAEKAHDFRSTLNALLASPRSIEVLLVQDEQGTPLVLASKILDGNQLLVPLLRMSSHSLAPTVVRHTLMEMVRDAASAKATCVRVTDKHQRGDVALALSELGFTAQSSEWIKPLLTGFHDSGSIMDKLSVLGIQHDCVDQDELGTLIWPAKPDVSDMPCYLVPIQAQWAEHFFDVDLASQRLPQISDIRTELHLGVEAVYYSASKNKFSVPGHILWYVSRGSEDMGSMTVKAVSRLRGALRGGPKQLFRQFRRLGVYEWKEVFQAARNDVDATLVALRFSHTERFTNPIKKAQLTDFGIKGNIQGPMAISHDTFKAIYQMGTQTDS